MKRRAPRSTLYPDSPLLRCDSAVVAQLHCGQYCIEFSDRNGSSLYPAIEKVEGRAAAAAAEQFDDKLPAYTVELVAQVTAGDRLPTALDFQAFDTSIHPDNSQPVTELDRKSVV